MDVNLALYAPNFYPMDSNHPTYSIAKSLRDLEKAHISSSETLFEICGVTPIYKELLVGSEFRKTLLMEELVVLVEGKSMPLILHIPLDMCFVIEYPLMMVARY